MCLKYEWVAFCSPHLALPSYLMLISFWVGQSYGREGELDTTAIFLASPSSSYVNGVMVPVDGGYTSM